MAGRYRNPVRTIQRLAPVLAVRVPVPPVIPITDLDAVAASGAGLADIARAPNTQRAYRSDWQHFSSWCAAQRLDALPAAQVTVGLYLSAYEVSLSVATLSRRLCSIAVAHRMAGHGFDPRHPAIADVMGGLRREKGSAQRHAEALTIPRLKQVLDRFGDSLGDLRDRALLLVRTIAALRRSELIGLDVADIAVSPEGLRISIRRSKTNEDGAGAVLPVNRTGRATCPAAAYVAWIAAAGIVEGAAFRSVTRHGGVGGRLTGNAVALIVQRRTATAGLEVPTSYTDHSMRAGFATSVARGYGRIPHRASGPARQAIRAVSSIRAKHTSDIDVPS